MSSSIANLASKVVPALALEDADQRWENTVSGSIVGRLLKRIKLQSKGVLLPRIGSMLQSAGFLCVLALLLALGLPQFANDKEGLALFVVAATLLRFAGWLMGGREKFASSGVDMLVLAFLAINVVATAASHYFEPSVRGLAKVVVYVAGYFAFSSCLQQSRKRILITLGCLLATGLVVALYGLYQYKIGVQPLATWEDPTVENQGTRIYSTLRNPNLLAAYLLPMIPLCLSMGLLALSNKNRLLGAALGLPLLACTVVFLGATVLTGSRGGLIGLGVTAFAYLVIITAHLWQGRFRWVALPLWGLPAAAAIVALKFVPTLQQRFMSIFAGWEHSSNAFRMQVWIASWHMFLDNWWFGIGPGNKTFVLAYGLYMTSGFDALGTYSVPLEIAVETGICGLLIFAALLMALMCRAHLSFWRGEDPFQRWLSAGAACAIVALMVQGLVDTVFLRPQVQMIFWLMAALIVSLKSQSRSLQES